MPPARIRQSITHREKGQVWQIVDRKPWKHQLRKRKMDQPEAPGTLIGETVVK